MRIVLVGPAHPLRGGIAHHTASLSLALGRKHEVNLISFRRQYPSLLFPGRSQHDCSSSALVVPSLPLIDSLSPGSWAEAGRRIEAWEPDVILFQWWQPFFGPAYRSVIKSVGSRRRVTVLLYCHNVLAHPEWRVPGRRMLERRLAKQTFRVVDGFLVQASSMIPEVHALCPGALVERVYHPLYDFFTQWDLSTPRVEESREPELLFFGNIRRYKGLEVFLRALGILRAEMPFRAVIAGEFYMDPRPFHRMAEQLGIAGRITWLDRYIPNEDVPSLFRRADLVVLPYLEASQSGVVPVAYLFNVPVVASDVGGLAEVVVDGETGFLVPPGNPKALAEAVVRFFREQRAVLFRKNIEEFRRRLTWDGLVESIEKLADRVAEKGRVCGAD